MLIIKPRSFSILVGGREVEIGSRVIEMLRIVKMGDYKGGIRRAGGIV